MKQVSVYEPTSALEVNDRDNIERDEVRSRKIP